MALVVKDRVQETSTTTGTGTLTLGGAVAGFQTFSSSIGNTNTTYYALENSDVPTEWEVGIGTVSAGQLSRDTVLESSNSGSLVNLSAGTKNVFCTYPAEKSVDIETAQTLTNKTVSGLTLNDGYTEEVYAIPSSTTPALSPTNGSIQTWTLTGNSTPTAGTWNAGQSMILMVNDSGSSFTVTWTSLPVTWVGGSAPSLAPASGFTVITLWEIGTTIYGSLVGQVA